MAAVPPHTGSSVVPVERSEGNADYRDAFTGSKATGASFEADIQMTLAALLDHMEQRSSEVLGGSTDRRCVAASRLCADMGPYPCHSIVKPLSHCLVPGSR